MSNVRWIDGRRIPTPDAAENIHLTPENPNHLQAMDCPCNPRRSWDEECDVWMVRHNRLPADGPPPMAEWERELLPPKENA